MARKGVSRDEVFSAADSLVGDGQSPTIKAVRERLGGTGSPNTIHRYLGYWRETRPVPTAVVHELPQALTSAIAEEINKAVSRVKSEKESELAQVREEAEDLANSGEILEVERDEIAQEVVELTTERDTLAGKAAQQALDLIEANERIRREQVAAEGARVELAKALLRVESQAERYTEQATELKRLRDALTAAEKGRVSAEQQAAVLAAKLEAVVERASSAEDRVKIIEQQAVKAAASSEEARDRAAKELREVQKERDQVREQAAKEIRQIQAERDEARKAAAEAREQAALAAGRLGMIKGKKAAGVSE